MTNPGGITDLLTIALIGMIFILFMLICVYLFLSYMEKRKKDSIKNAYTKSDTSADSTKKTGITAQNYSKQSIIDFMEFNKIEDNMIMQKNGERFLMIVECQGVNYDLMSAEEKAGVEAGFLQFLNTLRFPVQIYTQTRTVNLESSISTYKDRVKQFEDKLNKMKFDYAEMEKSGNYTREQLDKYAFEITKQTNLYEYGKDVIYNTETMSLNKNVLNKQYYVIIPYYSADLGNSKFDKEEIRSYSFSELYTRAQSILRTLASCDVNGKIMSSNELVELLYMAYNRDEAEVYGLQKALKAGYDEMYSTAEDVLEKQMRLLDKQIEEKAIEKANEYIIEAKSEKQKQLEEKEENIEDVIDELAKILIAENRANIGEDVAEIATEKISSETKARKGGASDVKKETNTRARRTKATA